MSRHYHIKQGSENVLAHYGTPRHSGRYPWGSGKNPQRNKNFLTRANELKEQGLSSTEIAKAFGYSTTQYRALYSMAVNEKKKDDIAKVLRLKEKGYSNSAIAKETGFPESTIRNYLKPDYQARRDTATKIAEVLKEQIEERPYLDVGEGVELQLGVTKEQMKTAIEMMKQDGYKYHRVGIRQVTDPSKELNVVVLTKGDVPYSEVKANLEKISSPEGVKFEDYADTLKQMGPPQSINSDRVKIRYAEDGGEEKDGVIEIREGVKDLDIGGSRYAQVRIAVDDTHYLKGMAMYGSKETFKDIPEGVDIIFNTNKPKGTPMISEDKDNSVLKPMKSDPENPFGASIKDQRGALNIVNEDEDWQKWSKTLSSQFLSKQSPTIAKKQLDKTYTERLQEFKDISALTNPVVKRKLLESYADECDSAAVHLKATAFPRQAAHVILPITSLKDNEIYAPNYKDGEEVVLIRYPHAGVFEIPRLRVNNQNTEGRELLQNAKTAVGINSHVASILSGADFDGDTVTVIPVKGLNIKDRTQISDPTGALSDLKDFNPARSYPAYEGMPRVSPKNGFHKQQEMGKVSNLITDMTIQMAPTKDICKAVKHSMVVIDAEKHNLDWKRSAKENDIAGLKKEYQGGANRGASTLISKSKSVEYVNDRKEYNVRNKMTQEEQKRYDAGEKIFRETGKTKINKNGKEVLRQTKSTKMFETDDARKLSSGTVMEEIYAEYANKTKALANTARKELRNTGTLKISSTAKQVYKEERASLISKLNIAKKNAPLERQAQLIAGVKAKARIDSNGITDRDDIKKIRQQELKRARDSIGTRPRNPMKENSLSIKISDREWEAIQAGAVSDTTLREILKYTDTDAVRQRATPRSSSKAMSSTSIARAKQLIRNGYTQSEVADALGVSVSTLNRSLDE